MQNAHCEQRRGSGNAAGHRNAGGNGKKRVEACPYCHETDEVIPILYGFPTHAGFKKAAGNLPGINVLPAIGANVYDILKYEKLVLLEGAIKGIEGRLLA